MELYNVLKHGFSRVNYKPGKKNSKFYFNEINLMTEHKLYSENGSLNSILEADVAKYA